MTEINGIGSAETWLKGQPVHVVRTFAARSALRGLPGLGEADSAILDQIALPVLRALIMPAVVSKMPAANMTELADSAARFVDSARSKYAAPRATDYSAASAARSADSAHSASSVPSAARCAYLATLSAGFSSIDPTGHVAAVSAAYSAHSADTKEAEKSDDMFKLTLWRTVAMPNGLVRNLETLRTFWKSTPEVWGFWERWYDGYLNGCPIDWDVQRAIATLPEQDWEKGPEWIAGKIAEIEARIALQKRIAELETALLSENAQSRGIGDNRPPEPIVDISDIPAELVIVWEPLQSLQQETQADVPDAGRVRRAIRTLVDIAVSCGAWTWEKANMFLDAGLKAGGAAASVALVTGHGEKILAVIKAALDWLAFWA